MKESKRLQKKLLTQLNSYKNNSELSSNKVQLLSLDIYRYLSRQEISIAQLKELVQLLSAEGLSMKVERLKRYLGSTDCAQNLVLVKKAINHMSSKSSFAQFEAKLQQEMLGIVITAHPTFSVSENLSQTLAQMVLSKSHLHKAKLDDLHKPDGEITVNYEHKISLQAIENIRAAFREVFYGVFEVARERYPKQWQKLTPRLITVASWVGYDLDGRADITWCDMLNMRMEAAVLQLGYYTSQCEEIMQSFLNKAEHQAMMRQLRDDLSSTRSILTNETLLLSEYAHKQTGFESLLKLKKSNDANKRAIDIKYALQQINRICDKTTDEQALKRLAVLRTEMTNYGICTSRIHVRINAVSCHNAIHETIRIERLPENSAEEQCYIESLNKLFVKVKPVTINLGNIIQEQTSLKRLFMVLVYIFKYIDTTPIRFLIAEVENPCTVLTVLYYAKLFGVEDKVEISPLFETERGVHRGGGIIETLLNNKHYYSYIKAHKKLCIQTGFSDSGRYIGQITASIALERIRMEIARLFVKYNLTNVQLVIFDTHGESIGRGSNPESIDVRLDYILSPANRDLLRELSVNFKHETSFQGGDGYLFFKNKDLALTTVTRLLQNRLLEERRVGAESDPFYLNNTYAFSFFFAIKNFHQELFEDPDYAILLNCYRDNMLYTMGSRPTRRQYELTSKVDYEHPSQVRAIPHNAILQQLGVLVNTACGFGEIVQKDPAKFVEMYKKSNRFSTLMSMVVAADQLSSFEVLDSYIELLNPEYWCSIAQKANEYEEKESALKLAALLEKDKRFESLKRVVRKIKMDRVKFYEVFTGVRKKTGSDIFTVEHRKYLDLLHAIRVALIQRIFLIIPRLPRFSSSPGNVTLHRIEEMLVRLEILPALEILRSTFPINTTIIPYKVFGKTTYSHENSKGYIIEHKKLFDPMEAAYDLIRQISTGVSYFNGAVG